MIRDIIKDFKKVFIFDKSEKKFYYGKDYTKKIKKFSQSVRWRNEANYIANHSKSNFDLGLDVGCNAGYGTEYLSSVFESKIIGIDISNDAVNKANTIFFDSRNEYVLYDGAKIPYPDNKFDFVTCFHVIGHVGSISDFISELHRVVRPGGSLFIVTPNATYKFFALLDSFINKYAPDLSIRKYWFSFELEKYLKSFGFSEVKSEFFGDLPRILKHARPKNFGRERLVIIARK